MPPHMHHMMRQWHQWIKDNSPQSEGAQGPQTDDKKDEDKKQESSQEASASGEEAHNVGDNYLKNVGEAVAAMLDPLGIYIYLNI
jgi:hypothetical protein